MSSDVGRHYFSLLCLSACLNCKPLEASLVITIKESVSQPLFFCMFLWRRIISRIVIIIIIVFFRYHSNDWYWVLWTDLVVDQYYEILRGKIILKQFFIMLITLYQLRMEINSPELCDLLFGPCGREIGFRFPFPLIVRRNKNWDWDKKKLYENKAKL